MLTVLFTRSSSRNDEDYTPSPGASEQGVAKNVAYRYVVGISGATVLTPKTPSIARDGRLAATFRGFSASL